MKQILLIPVILALLLIPCFSQMQNRVIYFDSDDESDSKQILKIVRIEVANKQIYFNKEFEADSDWLKTLKIKVRNMSHKPIIYVGVGFGLLDTVDAELESGASYQYGISFDSSKPIKNIKKRKPNFILNPNEEADLSYKMVDSDYKRVLEKTGIGRFHKAKFMVVRVQFNDGTFEDTQLIQ